MAFDEFSLIRSWTSRSMGQEGNGLSVGIGDDAAVFSVSAGMEIVACCDAMSETVHFLRETMKPNDIGYKAVISNISDVAAMGGIPRYALVSIGISPGWTEKECQEIYNGIYLACEQYHVKLIGGDTVATPDALHLAITMLGEVESGKALRRTGAKQGDAIFVTGYLGASAAGLHLMLSKRDAGVNIEPPWQSLILRHQRPSAQVEAGRLLIASNHTGALNDISDGLASELWEIAEASGVGMLVERDRIPVDEDTRTYAAHVGKEVLDWALYGGEDYQLVGTVRQAYANALVKDFAEKGLLLTVIGQVQEGPPSVRMKWNETDEQPLRKAGFNHFQRS